jgi:hypothetical protein
VSVSTTTSLAQYTGNGATTVFAVPFQFFDPGDIIVTLDGVTLTINTDYTVTGGADNVGNVTFNVVPANGTAIVIDRFTPPTQPYVFRNQGQYFAVQHESAMDRIILVVQDLMDKANLLALLAAAMIYDLCTYYPFVTYSGQFMGKWKLAHKVTYATNFAGSYAAAGVAATGSTVFNVTVNGVSKGTITFGVGATTGTFACTAFTAYPGDLLAISAPNTPDATLSEITISLVGTRVLT